MGIRDRGHSREGGRVGSGAPGDKSRRHRSGVLAVSMSLRRQQGVKMHASGGLGYGTCPWGLSPPSPMINAGGNCFPRGHRTSEGSSELSSIKGMLYEDGYLREGTLGVSGRRCPIS